LAVVEKTRDVASDEALLAESYAAGCDECGRHPALKPRLHSLACRLSTRLREVLAERDAKDAEIEQLRALVVQGFHVANAKDAEIARLKVEAVDRSGEWGWHVCRDGKIVKHAWIFCNRQCRPEGVQPLTGPVAELDSITAERDALKAQLAEAREEAALLCDAAYEAPGKDFGYGEGWRDACDILAQRIRALKSGERVNPDGK
jgi:hypothetical protein